MEGISRGKVSAGRVVLPAELRKAYGIQDGADVVFSRTEHGIEIRTLDEAIRQARICAKYITPGVDLVEELRKEPPTGTKPLSKVVLDASALLALVQDEPGAEKVRPLIPHAAISAVNFCETVQRLRRGGMPVESVAMVLTPLVQPVAFDRETAYIAASIHEKTRGQGISFGDCACLALAMLRGVPAVTAERKWDQCDVGVQVFGFADGGEDARTRRTDSCFQ